MRLRAKIHKTDEGTWWWTLQRKVIFWWSTFPAHEYREVGIDGRTRTRELAEEQACRAVEELQGVLTDPDRKPYYKVCGEKLLDNNGAYGVG